MDITILFGTNIKKFRKERELSQERLAELSGLHRTYIGSVERGERNITLKNAYLIAQALDVKLTECLQEKENDRPK
jgi:transcriptional regulator with XRE-family HTH domain